MSEHDTDRLSDLVRSNLLRSAEVKRFSAEECSADIAQAVMLVANCFQSGGKILLCGNGGSAADCQHIATEFTSVLAQTFVRPALPAIALTTDTSFLTARSNDFGFEDVFARLVEALGRPGDVLIGISTSGNSANVVRAIQLGKELDLRTIVLTGHRGGQLESLGDVVIKVPSSNTSHIQEAHIAIGHTLCALVEQIMFADAKATGTNAV